MKLSYLAVLPFLVLLSCNNPSKETPWKQSSFIEEKDRHTLSNADSCQINHLDLDINIDIKAKQISGSAVWSVNNQKYRVKDLILDAYNLEIDSVFADGIKKEFIKDTTIKYLGNALHIPIDGNTKKVTVYYKTGNNAHALQWLEPEQTNDKKNSFLFTQSESIFARSWIPCPDGPGIRFTYSARVKVPAGMLALMSAENPQQKNDSNIYHFQMPFPVPAYLMALAVGDIAFRKIDDRTGVYAEPGMIDKVRWELEDVGKMVTTAEQLYGAYRWKRYDVLVLPPGFPIGGMENPKLTFATPTIIAGDRSLVNLIAHELAHSWSGNLVTNATWNDFWLNEGFTNYFERRITEKMMGESYADMLWQLGYQTLVDNVKELGATNKDTWLKGQYDGRDPDEGFTDIPYEKGSLFLKMLETKYGRPKFDSFLRQYFDVHAFKSISTEQFLQYLDEHLIQGNKFTRKELEIVEWVYAPGIPENCPRFAPARFKAVDSLAKHFPVTKTETNAWTTFEWLYYFHLLDAKINMKQMKALDGIYHFSETGNCEIADIWYIMAVRTNYQPAFGEMEKFLSKVGRRKFLEPLYGEMMKTKTGETMAKHIYEQYRKNYHPIAQASLDKIVLGRKL